ncbi:MAG: hypothetical protein ACI8X5_002545 [Planctomycetota bacterium]|jgi:hypothetical protein
MYLSHIIPALVLSIGGGHGDLHPSNTNLYIEVPNIKDVLAAYEQAPLANFIRDEAVSGFIAQMMGRDAESITMTGLLTEGMGFVRQQLPPVGGEVLDLISDVEHFSLSLAGLEIDGLTEELLAKGSRLSPDLRARISGVRVRLILDFSSADTASDSVDMLQQQVDRLAGEGEPLAVSDVSIEFNGEKLDWTYIQTKEGEVEFGLWYTIQGSRVIFCAGITEGFEGLLLGGGSLAESADFTSSYKHFENNEGVIISNSYTRLDGMDELARLLYLIPEISPELMGMGEYLTSLMFPNGSVEVSSQTRLVGNSFVAESFAGDFTDADAPCLLSEEPVTRDSFSMVAPGSSSAFVANLDKDGIKAILLGVLTTLSDGTSDELLASLEESYGFRPDRDLVDSLGGQLAYYGTSSSGVGVPKSYLALDLDDPEAFARGIEGLGKFLVDATDGHVAYYTRAYRKHPFATLSPGDKTKQLMGQVGPDWMPAALSLTMAVGLTDDRALISMSSMYTKREMKRILGGKDTGRFHLMDSGDEFPAGVNSYSTTDYGQIMAGTYGMLRSLLPLILSAAEGVDLPFAIEDMPEADVFTEHFKPTVIWNRAVPDGTYTHTVSPFGPEMLVLGAGVGFGVAAYFATQGVSEERVDASQLSPPVPVMAGPGSTTETNIASLNLAVIVYKHEVGTYPRSLALLLDPTENFPSGTLEAKELPVDGWSQSFFYSFDEQAGGYRIWSPGPNGVDEKGGGDDLEFVGRN